MNNIWGWVPSEKPYIRQANGKGYVNAEHIVRIWLSKKENNLVVRVIGEGEPIVIQKDATEEDLTKWVKRILGGTEK